MIAVHGLFYDSAKIAEAKSSINEIISSLPEISDSLSSAISKITSANGFSEVERECGSIDLNLPENSVTQCSNDLTNLLSMIENKVSLIEQYNSESGIKIPSSGIFGTGGVYQPDNEGSGIFGTGGVYQPNNEGSGIFRTGGIYQPNNEGSGIFRTGGVYQPDNEGSGIFSRFPSGLEDIEKKRQEYYDSLSDEEKELYDKRRAYLEEEAKIWREKGWKDPIAIERELVEKRKASGLFDSEENKSLVDGVKDKIKEQTEKEIKSGYWKDPLFYKSKGITADDLLQQQEETKEKINNVINKIEDLIDRGTGPVYRKSEGTIKKIEIPGQDISKMAVLNAGKTSESANTVVSGSAYESFDGLDSYEDFEQYDSNL